MGAVYVPLNVGYTAAELDYFIGDSQPSLFVCRPQDKAAVESLCTRHEVKACETLGIAEDGTFSQLISGRDVAGFIDCARNTEDLAVIIYTSGTTGRSKGAMKIGRASCRERVGQYV